MSDLVGKLMLSLALVAAVFLGAVETAYGDCGTYTAYITFDAGGGTGSMAKQTLKTGPCYLTQYIVPACTFKRKGYRFIGWRRDCCCMYDDRQYQPGENIWDLDDCVPYAGSTMRLTACWEMASGIEEDYLYIGFDTSCVEMDVGEWFYDDDVFYVESGSDWTISVSGLPTGLKFDAKTRRITGNATRRGVYYSTFSAKNDNGYKHTAILKWNVGNAYENEYDNIGWIFETLEYAEAEYGFEVGRFLSTCFNANLKSVTGLPPGLKFNAGSLCSGGSCTACSDFISGTPTKAGKYTLTFTDEYGGKAVKNIIVRDSGSRYFSVGTCYGQSYCGTVTKSGVYDGGKKVSISATPKSGYYFAGWYCDPYGETPFYYGDSGDYRSARDSFVMGSDIGEDRVYARFVSKYEDSYIDIDCASEWNVCTECGSDWFWIDVESESKPTLTAKGLPSGVKLTKWGELEIADTSKLKPGTSEVTLTAKNLSGAVATRRILIRVPNLRSWVFDDIDYEGVYTYTAGISDACSAPVPFYFESGWKVTASGVPSGMKLQVNNEYGLAYLSGTPTKAGVYTVTLTAKQGTLTEKATFTIEILPFPESVVGTYGGVFGYDLEFAERYEDLYCVSEVEGTFTITVAKGGKISAKFMSNGKTVSLSGYSCDWNGERLYVALRDSRGNMCDLEISPAEQLGGYQISGMFTSDYHDWSVLGQVNRAKTDSLMKQAVERLSKIGRIQGVPHDSYIDCPDCGDYGGTPALTFTVSADGTVKSSGKIEGRYVSGSAMLQVLDDEADYKFFADFYDYKSTGGELTYRVVFSWDWLNDSHSISGRNALYEGEYSYWGGGLVAAKPVIYLYPEEETICSVKVNLDGKFTSTYPDHGQLGWREFVAAPDGTLTFADMSQYYCLFWEGRMNTKWDFSRGYCVKGTDTAAFLSEILLKMGLSFREANEFIIYWLPQMQDNPYNVIAFQGDNYQAGAELEITPKPDSLLRIFMAWRPSERFVPMAEPVVEPFVRRGFTVVEWGGTKVN